jgi:hypothetical protein
MKTIIIYVLTTIVLATIIILAANADVYELPNKKGAVVCSEGFFYDMSTNPTQKDVEAAEKLAREHCEITRTVEDYRWKSGPHQGKQKHAVLLEEGLCVINMELTPIGHKVAFNNICKPN